MELLSRGTVGRSGSGKIVLTSQVAGAGHVNPGWETRNDEAQNSEEVIQNLRMDLDSFRVCCAQPKTVFQKIKPRTTRRFLRTVGRLFLQRSSSVCSYKELLNFEPFSNNLLAIF